MSPISHMKHLVSCIQMVWQILWPFKYQTINTIIEMASEYQTTMFNIQIASEYSTICPLDNFLPFEYCTSPVQ